MKNDSSGSAFGILPVVLFLVVFIGTSTLAGDFYQIPPITSFFITAVLTLTCGYHYPLKDRITAFTASAGHGDIVTMVLIFMFAGVFSKLALLSGAADNIVQFGITWIPHQLLVPGFFLLSSLVSFAMGSSVGVIVTVGPIGFQLAQSTGHPAAMILGAIVSGAMFGDNLSLISDTTIAAVNSQNCAMTDKFKYNSRIALPAALITTVLYGIYGNIDLPAPEEDTHHAIDYLRMMPYFAVVILALLGWHVFYVLSAGIGLCLITLAIYETSTLSFLGVLSTISEGLQDMLELSLLSMISAGLVGLIHLYGGMNYILRTLSKRIHSQRSAAGAIAAIASLIDACTANNTVTIIIGSPLAKEIKQKYQLSSQAVASYLDIFAACVQGVIPYGAQLLFAAKIAHINPMDITPHVFYSFVLFVIAGIFILRIPNQQAPRPH
ncbi:MAG: Na+/H+ antiporter NhaC family protein [Zetaproteobacteria bacterium]|nr:Na+/H+ antiporter NhaC family protein [Zetaproteobacteria bacterium]